MVAVYFLLICHADCNIFRLCLSGTVWTV